METWTFKQISGNSSTDGDADGKLSVRAPNPTGGALVMRAQTFSNTRPRVCAVIVGAIVLAVIGGIVGGVSLIRTETHTVRLLRVSKNCTNVSNSEVDETMVLAAEYKINKREGYTTTETIKTTVLTTILSGQQCGTPAGNASSGDAGNNTIDVGSADTVEMTAAVRAVINTTNSGEYKFHIKDGKLVFDFKRDHVNITDCPLYSNQEVFFQAHPGANYPMKGGTSQCFRTSYLCVRAEGDQSRGYWPLAYTGYIAKLMSPKGTSHTHVLNNVTYHMPDGFEGAVHEGTCPVEEHHLAPPAPPPPPV